MILNDDKFKYNTVAFFKIQQENRGNRIFLKISDRINIMIHCFTITTERDKSIT